MEGGHVPMLFRKKRLFQSLNDELLFALERAKDEWLMRKKLLEKSIEPSDLLDYELKLAEAKYLFLLREAKLRKLTLKR